MKKIQQPIEEDTENFCNAQLDLIYACNILTESDNVNEELALSPFYKQKYFIFLKLKNYIQMKTGV